MSRAAGLTSPFAAIAHLFEPLDAGVPRRVIEADRSWHLPDVDAGLLIWGRPPPRAPAAHVRFVGDAVRREGALLQLRLQAARSRRRLELHRLPPARRAGRLRHVVRDVLLAGVVAVVGESASVRVVDAVLAAADARLAGRLRFSGDGSLRARVRTPDALAELRIVPRGSSRDPEIGARAMRELAARHVPHAPRLLGHGAVADLGWSLETVLPGAMPRALSPALLDDVVDFCAALVTPGEPITSTASSIRAIGSLAPEHGEALGMLERWAADVSPTLPAVIEHGDLWSGNLLADRGQLSGVVDWDTWRPNGVPGVDLLQLVAMRERARTKQEPGELFLRRLWEGDAYRRLADRYWRLLGLQPNRDQLMLVGLDWWTGQVAMTLQRPIRRRLAHDPDWRRRNVDDVVGRIGAIAGPPAW